MENLFTNAPAWAVGTALILFVVKEIWLTYISVFNPKDVLQKYQSIYNELDYIEAETGAGRVALYKGHNSGQPLEGFSRMFSSVIASTASTEKWRKINESWQKVEVDANYIDTIKDIFENKVIEVNVEDLPKDSILHNMMCSEDIATSLVYIVGYKKQRDLIKTLYGKPKLVTFIYISVDFTKRPVEMAKVKEVIRSASNQIKNLLDL